VVQTFLILGIIFSPASDTIDDYRLTFSSIVVVFAVIGVDRNVYHPLNRAQCALSAGWLVTAAVDLLWVGYFTTLEMDSAMLRFVDGFGGGVGGISGTRARARARGVTAGQVEPPENREEKGSVTSAVGDLAQFRYPPPRSVMSLYSQDERDMQIQKDSGESGQAGTASTAVDKQVMVMFTAQAMYSCEFRFFHFLFLERCLS